MIGKKLYKNNADDMAQYTATAKWCNANNAHIEDKGEYYEVCENVVPEPTTEEKIAALDASYSAQKQELANEYTDALIHADTDAQELVQQEMTELDDWYDEEYRKIEGGE
ncbi:hypothetical protein [Selenomonas ruminantium]|uniref:Uncharacterized protein n=1 Tax=Selenomonas ruminantium TaxID=971 RepID=A0A1I0VHM2_SELRU|nr:hypothetical protein [Selenomonas ruminantium]SFA75812.1 hypothetical protein SAMN05216587_101622 [Selenomonas ruminantium]